MNLLPPILLVDDKKDDRDLAALVLNIWSVICMAARIAAL